MSPLTLRRIILSIAGALIASIGLSLLWGYILSFQDVTFHYDEKLGQVELIDHDNHSLYPKNNQPIQLTEGEYHIQYIGDHIEPQYRAFRVTNDTTDVHISYSYTRKHLDALLDNAQPAITSTLYDAYPLAKQSYSLQHERLYELGDVYGAILVAREKSDNSDTLRVLLEKRNGKWVVRSTPPTPVLSTPDYSSIDEATLSDINQAK